MFIATLLTIAKLQKELKCPSTDKWVKKMRYIYTMEYYLAIEKNEILPFATTRLELQNMMLTQVSQRKTNTI